jgi:L-serine dehydratase
MEGNIQEVLIRFDPRGSLAETHESQGSDMGLFGGFLGWEPTDERLMDSATALEQAGVKARIEITEFHAPHPNTYKLTLKNASEQHEMTALSTGGGMVEIIEIDGFKVSILGDCYETLIFLNSAGREAFEFLSCRVEADEVVLYEHGGTTLIEIKGKGPIAAGTASELQAGFPDRSIKIPFSSLAGSLAKRHGGSFHDLH